MSFNARLLAASLVALPAVAFAADLPPGRVVVARTTGPAVVLYNASPEVAAIVTDKIADADANDRLERDALKVLAAKLPLLQDATSVTVRVIYDLSGAVSPVYNSPTYAGTIRYANLTMSAADAKSDRDHWKEASASTQALPASLKFVVADKLPPR